MSFLAKEWKKATANKCRLVVVMGLVFVLAMVFILRMVLVGQQEIIDLTDPDTRILVVGAIAMAAIMLLSIAVVIVKFLFPGKEGSHLLVYDSDTESREQLAEKINADAREGRFLMDAPIYDLEGKDKIYGERIVVTDSYVLIMNVKGTGRVQYIPRDRLYWVCAKPGIQGSSSFVTQLLLFTEKQIFAMDGVDTDYVMNLAQRIYQYIPNPFAQYEPVQLAFTLEEMYRNDRPAFIDFLNHHTN